MVYKVPCVRPDETVGGCYVLSSVMCNSGWDGVLSVMCKTR